MPKGFLIKRSKKAGPVSYRMREEDLALVANCSPLVENAPAHALPSVCHNFIRVPSRVICGGMPESHCAPSLSPTRPDSEGYQYPSEDAAHQMLSSLSPAPEDTFPEANLGSFAIDGSPVSPSLPEMTTRLDIMCGNARYAVVKRPAFSNSKSPYTNSKKRKSSSSPNQEKKSIVRDEVTTSPVLGLRITEEAEDEVKQRSNTSSPLGEFICQLCKERYADPLTLALHKCSRIVRVEYRCDECDKVFSCPANLASHRRWHKPKGFQVERVSSQREESRPDTPTARDALPPSPPPSDSGSDEEIMFSCPQCSKKFRKQAYLRKHLALHNRKAASHTQNQTPSSPLAIVTDQQHSCPLESGRESPQPCAKYAGAERITKVTGEVFPCRFCGDNFFSSPGLTRHINKYHPTERRQPGVQDGTSTITNKQALTGKDQPHSAPFSSENEAQGGDSAGWQCITPSTSPSGETLSHPSAQPPSRPSSRPESQTPSRSLSETKKRSHSHSNKPAHMRRNIRKLLREHQLEVVTKAAQQEELERRERLEQQRKEGHFPVPLLPEYTPGDLSQSLSASVAERDHVICLDTIYSSTNVSEDDSKALITEAHAPKEDVIELSSDEDDALQISSESTNEVENRSAATGAHTNDAVNQPDAQGRVLVNLNHPAEEADLFLSSHLARAVKPHQIGGIRFLYDNLIESLERYGSSSGFGCILAHSMGLGKTLQVISFIDIVLRHTQAHTVLAIVPVNTLQNWLAEFNLWLPTSEALPVDVDPTQVSPRTFKVHILNDEHKTMTTRAKVISDWSRDGGVLLMGYEMYRLLSLKKSFVAGRKKSKKAQGPVVIDLDEEDRHQELLKGIEKALSRPGPDVVICDEGHRIKNCHASTSQALKNIHTRRRVVLTGYPLQNNLIEYWCMVDFVRPDFLGTRQEFSNMFERPILNGQCVDSTPQDVQLMRYRSHVLHSLLEGFVQRRGHDVLRDQLPSKDEHVILVRLSPLQRALYTEFMNRFREAGNSGWLSLNPLKAFCVCCKIWNHTDVLYEALQKENLANEQDLELDDITNSHARCPAPNQKGKTPEDPNSIGGLSLNALQERANQVITYEWAKEIMSDYKPGVLENSAKMVLLFHLIDESVRKGDKILVFSQSLSTLSVIEEFLAKRPIPAGSARDGHNQNWLRNHNYYRLDGSTSASERERLINQFNDPSNTSTLVFLLSTRAGCLGVNLIGANRVVVFDASWNPCHDAQAVCRVYRYGQKKPCHIYRLVCDFTLEKKIYDRQISKQGMSDRVVDDLNPMLSFTRREVESLLHFVEEEPDVSQVQLQPHQEMEASIRQACQLYPHLVTKQPFHHESLLIDRQEMKLTKAEKKAAKKSYEDEKRASVPYTRPSYAHYYPASDQSLTNIPAFSQRNWRPPPRQDEKPVASDRPVQSTPVPMMPRQASHASTPTADSDSSSGFPVNYLQKAGVFVQKIVTTTDIVIPGTNSSTDVKARISAGESIHVIRGTKGTYIRTCDGRIFAIRAASKLKAGEENSAVAPKDTQKASEEASTNGTSGCVTRPLSPDSPEILSELQRYTAAAGNKIQQQQASKAPSAGVLETALAESTNGSSMTSHAKPWRHTAAQPNTDSTAALDLKATKRKASTPSADEWANNKQLAPGKCTSAPLPPQALPFAGGYGFPPMGLNPAMMGSIEQPLFMGAGSPYFQPHSQLGDPCLMFPMTSDPFGLGDGTLPSSSSRSSSSTTTSSFSASSDSASLAPFMLGAGMAGMLPPGFPMSYGQSVGMYPSSLLPGGLPAATPGPAGSSFLSHFPSSGLMGAGLGRSDTHGSAENAGSSSDSKNDDDDVIEVMEQ